MKLNLRLLSMVCSVLAAASLLVGFSPAAPVNEAHPPIHIKKDGATPTYQNGFQPSQIKTAYSLNNVTSTGKGQTIAIIDAYGSPSIQNDLTVFSQKFGLPLPNATNFNVVYPDGKPKKPDGGWALETSLDVEWAHAIAPDANILLVVAKSASLIDLLSAVDYATHNHAQVVSMSWGGSEFSTETSYNSYFNHQGVVYVASSGDSGAGMSWPASSPYVLSVGGTTLKLDSSNHILSEIAWSGSGGGTSKYEKMPDYQSDWIGVVGKNRGGPDVAWDADPNTGVAVYYSTPYNGQKGWFQVGGTSFGAPCWASLIVLANEGRKSSLTSFQAITKLYHIVPSDYHDITLGNNGGYTAKSGYDLVTGLGSPYTDSLISALLTD